MQVSIKEIRLKDFKGCKEQSFNFGEKNNVVGKNGAGKTTIATAWFWLMSDKDYALKSNPAIRPLDTEECTPRVDVVLDVNGVPVTVSKFQKRTVRKSRMGGADSVSLSNSYEVNCVEYGERDFKNKLAEYGIDFDLFLPLSHIEVFTGQKSNDMRKVLFDMASNKSDCEIAKLVEGCTEVQHLLENYTMEEIKAMQNATMRKIKEDYGKEGEILRAKIEGLEAAKVDVDVSEYELGKKALEEMLKNNKTKQERILEQINEIEKVQEGVLDLKFKLNELQHEANKQNDVKRATLKDEISDIKSEIATYELVVKDCASKIEFHKTQLTHLNSIKEKLKNEFKDTQELKFDENSLVCSYCKQEYPPIKKERIRADFEKEKQTKVSELIEAGNRVNKEIINHEKECEKEVIVKEQSEKYLQTLKTKLDGLQKEIEIIPSIVDISSTDEYKNILQQISEKEKITRIPNIDRERIELSEEEEKLRAQMSEIDFKIAKSTNNVAIDEKIDELLKKQAEYEQSKANCEKILYQLDLVSRKKNELLTDEINSHFNLVKFKLFDYRKNGEYVECCIPSFNGKDLKVSTNTGLEIMMKADIVRGLQNFYNQHYPVFIDGAESLDTKNKNDIILDTQMIYLSVSDNADLTVQAE